MSYYYTYYLGVKKEDGKIYPYGPFDNKGKLETVLSKSRSFASNLYERFETVKPEIFSTELYKSLLITDYYEEIMNQENSREALEKSIDIKVLPLSALPAGDFIKEGYILYDQIDESYEDYWPILSPHEYAERLKNHFMFKDKEKPEDEEDDIQRYVYHKWMDRTCEEYDSWIIRMMADTFWLLEKGEIVVLETEG